MAELAGRTYVPRLYSVSRSRTPVIDLLLRGIADGGGRVTSCSFPDQLVAPVFIGAEDSAGHRYGLLVYPFTTTRRSTTNRPSDEHRFQVRFGDPERNRSEPNPIGRDPAAVDATLVLAVDPENQLIVGLDPLVYSELPMGSSGYYRDEHFHAARRGWSTWAKEKSHPRSRQGENWDGLESMVGFRPERLLDYVRFEVLAASLGLDTALRSSLAQEFETGHVSRHDLERMFGVDAKTILDIIDANFRLGVAVRGGVAEHHLARALSADPTVDSFEQLDLDGQPDFRIQIEDGRKFTIECKNALRETYKDGDAKVELQKTRDSGAGRKYLTEAFDIAAACMYSVTGRWTFRFAWTRDLATWDKDSTRLAATHRIDDRWKASLTSLLRDTGVADPPR